MVSAIKKEVESAAVAAIKCPSCDVEAGYRCRKRDGSNALTHQRRLSAFISSDNCRFSTSRPVHVLCYRCEGTGQDPEGRGPCLECG